MFVDRVTLEIAAGKGGNGVIAWRREKYIPKGGPCGGNGGKGGDVILVADRQVPSLEWFRNRSILKAENGVQGGSSLRQGRNGKSLTLKVPCGTLVKDAVTGELLHDFTSDGERWVLCHGGKGGRGNDSFKTPTNRAPQKCTEGKAGEAAKVEIELKLIADVGLVGFPNAGKSTLIKALTDTPVKVAAYPFTTLQPNIGFIECEDYTRIFIADIPGIIEGAHRNRGLGFEFLRHIERTTLLLYVVDGSGIDGRDPATDLKVLLQEISSYNEELKQRPFLTLYNKIDTDEAKEHFKQFKESYPFAPQTLFTISATSGEGLDELRTQILLKFRLDDC